MAKRKGECLLETHSLANAHVAYHRAVAEHRRPLIRACTLPEGGRGWRVWGYSA